MTERTRGVRTISRTKHFVRIPSKRARLVVGERSELLGAPPPSPIAGHAEHRLWPCVRSSKARSGRRPCLSPEVQLVLGWRASRVQHGYIGGQTQAAQEGDDHGPVRDRRDDLGPRAATGAGEHIQGKDAAHQLGPGQLAARFCARSGFGWRCSRCATRHDVRPQTRVGRKDTVVAHQVCPGTRDERGQLFNQLQR